MSPELRWLTPPEWARAALRDPFALLVDHAHCELGAASTAQTLIARHPSEGRLVDALAALAAEELRHFRRVHRLLEALGGELQPIQANPYAVSLVRSIDRASPEALLDRMLVSALIERRSLERFELLGVAAEDGQPEIAELFRELGPSEAGHARLFVDLATELFPNAEIEPRLEHWAELEARVIQALPFAPRIHSGPPVKRSAPSAETQGAVARA